MISGKAGQSVLTLSFMTSCRFYITRSQILYIITRKCSEFAPGFIPFASHCKVFRPKCNKSRKKHYICNPLWLDHRVNVATLAQLVEQRIRNAQVVGSSPTISSKTCVNTSFSQVFSFSEKNFKIQYATKKSRSFLQSEIL